MPSPILRPLDLPNLFTLTGLVLTILSVLFAINGRLSAAVLCMLYAGLVDTYDGVLARRLPRSPSAAEVGRNLDSLVDLCSFGLGPIVFGYCAGLRHPVVVLVLILYGLACASRLAYFNATGMSTEGGMQYFTGLPVTYAALFVPITFLTWFVVSRPVALAALVTVYGVMAILMVSGVRIRKPPTSWKVGFSLVALVLTGVYTVTLFRGDAPHP